MALTDIQMQAIQDAEDIDTGVDTRTKEERVKEQMSAIKSIGKGALFSPITGAADIVDMGAALPPVKPGTESISPVYSALEKTFNQLSEAGLNRENVVAQIKKETGIELKGDAPELIGEIVGLPAIAATKVATALFKAVGKSADEAKQLFRTASGGDDFDGMAPAVAGDVKAQTDQLIAKPDLPDTSISPNMIGLNTPQGRAAVKEYTVAQSKFPDISNEELFQRTGVYKGRDEKFRYELDTTNAKLVGKNFKRVNDSSGSWDSVGGSYIKLDNKNATLGDILNFDSLYKEYSKDLSIPVKGRDQEFKVFKPIQNIKIVRLEDAPFPTKNTTQAAYSAAEDTIYIGDASDSQELLSSILHEVQHAIQRREGFISGSDSSRFLPKDFDEKYTEVKKAVGVLQRKAKKQPNNTTLKNALGTAGKRMTRMKTQLQEATINYMKKYGEIEARNVQLRKNMRINLQRQGMSDEQIQKIMRTVPPEETQMFKGEPIKTEDTFDERDELSNVFKAFDPDNQPVAKENKGGLMLQKGGAIPMDRQMSMFDEGGLEDDGGTVDPVSGNDVPPGSSKAEVRDDIPAQLSEGEFVFPADVVRYIGLEKLMMMRQQAKMGLKMMDEMGQMGNSDEATIPDDLPFNMMDLIIVDNEDEEEYNDKKEEKEMSEGGIVYAANGTSVPAVDSNSGVFYQPSQFAGQGNTPGVATVAPDAASRQFVEQARQSATPTVKYEKPETTYGDFLKPPQGGPQTITIVDSETGEKRKITFIPGVTEIPTGFVREEDYVAKEVVPEKETARVETTRVSSEEPEGDTGVEQGGAFGDMQRMKDRIDLAKKMGVTEMTGVSEGLGGTIGTFGKDSIGKMTGTGYIIGEGGQLLDPLTGTLVKGGDTSLNPLNIISGAFDDKYNKQTPYGEAYFDALPSSVKDVMGVQMGGQARKDRIAEAKAKQEKYKSDLAFDKEDFGKSDAAVRNEKRKKKAEEIAQTTNKIKQAQAKARAEMRAKEDAAATAARIAREQIEIASGNNKDSDGNNTTAQQASDDYTASAVAEAVSTGDYSRGFNEGGLASKPKPKAKKKMKRGGLASKK